MIAKLVLFLIAVAVVPIASERLIKSTVVRVLLCYILIYGTSAVLFNIGAYIGKINLWNQVSRIWPQMATVLDRHKNNPLKIEALGLLLQNANNSSNSPEEKLNVIVDGVEDVDN
jgi:hypothetical protein